MEITPVTPVPRTTKVRNTKATEPKLGKTTTMVTEPVVTKPRKRKTVIANAPSHAPEALQHMIATAAYYLAEQRCFAPGYEVQDWLAAERQILSTVAHP